MNSNIDVSEILWFHDNPTLVELLMKNHTQKDIFDTIDSYASKGNRPEFNDEIAIEQMTGDNESIINQRRVKSREELSYLTFSKNSPNHGQTRNYTRNITCL